MRHVCSSCEPRILHRPVPLAVLLTVPVDALRCGACRRTAVRCLSTQCGAVPGSHGAPHLGWFGTWWIVTPAVITLIFPRLPQQPGYNKRLRAAASLIRHCIQALAADTSVWTDDVWVVDSTPVECGRSRGTAKRSKLAGWAEYGYCASHSRYFWGLRLHLVCTLPGLPVAFALVGAKAGEREVLTGMFTADPQLVATRPGQTLSGDKNYFGAGFEATIAGARIKLLRPARKGEPERAGAQFFKPLRQIIESTPSKASSTSNNTAATTEGVTVRVLQRILALTAAIWHNDRAGQPVKRSLLGYDH